MTSLILPSSPLFLKGAGAAPANPLAQAFRDLNLSGPTDAFQLSPELLLKPAPAATPAAPSRPAPDLARLAPQGLEAARVGAMGALFGPQAAAFSVLWDSTDRHGEMLDLLERGRLTQSDGQHTALEHLATLSSTPRAAGWNGSELAGETLDLLFAPDAHAFQGHTTYTCGATNLEHQLAEEQPALLAGAVAGLSAPAGQAALPTGHPLRRPDGTQAPDSSGRNGVNRLVQASLMDGFSQHGAYDPQRDRFADGSNGLQPVEVVRATNLLRGEPHVAVWHDSKSDPALRQLMEQTGPKASLQVGMSWNRQDHLMLFRGCEDGQAAYFNPQGETGSLPLKDFLWKMQFIVVPERQVQQLELPPECTIVT